MSSKIELNVNQYGDELPTTLGAYGDQLLRLYVNGDLEAAIDMYTVVQKACDGLDKNRDEIKTLIALTRYQNEGIVDKTVGAAVVDSCLTLRAQGHPKFSRPATTPCDEKKDVKLKQQHLDELITKWRKWSIS